MARVKIAYIGGGSTRGAGTMASFIEQGENFSGSEIVLIDLDADRLELIRGLAQRMAAAFAGRNPADPELLDEIADRLCLSLDDK